MSSFISKIIFVAASLATTLQGYRRRRQRARDSELALGRTLIAELPTSDDLVIVMINDRDRSVSSQVAQIGDRIAQWIRWIHEGSHSGPIWSAIVFLCGVFPPVFVVTGMIMWLRARANRKTLERKRNDAVPQLRPAE